MIRKYEDDKDPVIQETLQYWKTHPMSIFNQHLEGYQGTLDELIVDENVGLSYIWFETVEGKRKKMYYPQDYATIVTAPNGKRYVSNVLMEQVPTSPHLYIKGEHKVNQGDVLIDCGVCEGNFALKYVDVCSQIYLFETEARWLKPLYHTFQDYLNKVVIVPKFVSNVVAGNQITLDEAVRLTNQNIFLKMDIEGSEIAGLRGAKNLLTNNKIKASICSYHKPNDLWQIKSIFHQHGYKTATSDGYMVLLWPTGDVWDTADFRKGIVYAENY